MFGELFRIVLKQSCSLLLTECVFEFSCAKSFSMRFVARSMILPKNDNSLPANDIDEPLLIAEKEYANQNALKKCAKYHSLSVTLNEKDRMCQAGIY